MAHNYLRHRRGGAGFYEELSSDLEEYEEHDELDPVEGENVAELGIILDDDFLEEDGFLALKRPLQMVHFSMKLKISLII